MEINTNGINFEQLQFNNFQLPAVNGNNLNQIQTNIKNAFENLLDSIMPIGKIEIFLDDSDYSNYMGFKWKRVAQGKNLVGVGTGTDKNLNSKEFVAENNDGEYSHSLLKTELPKEKIEVPINTTADSYGGIQSTANPYKGNIVISQGGEQDAEFQTAYLGDGIAIDITNPSYGVYIWQRYE